MTPWHFEADYFTACACIGDDAAPSQRAALDLIATGKVGCGIFELLGSQRCSRWLPTRHTPIVFELNGSNAGVRVHDFGEAESELLSYPDGGTIRPWLDLPHGIEY